MKKTRRIVSQNDSSLLLVLIFWIISAASFAQQQILQWSVFHPVKKEWIPAGTHGSVQEILMSTGELPDPFVGENEKEFAWIERHDWEFNSVFNISGKEMSCNFIELEFPGIDTYASVYLNDSLILDAENAFHPYRAQVRDLVRLGENKLKVVFTSPVNYHRAAFEAMTTKLPAPNDVGEIAISSMSRSTSSDGIGRSASIRSVSSSPCKSMYTTKTGSCSGRPTPNSWLMMKQS